MFSKALYRIIITGGVLAVVTGFLLSRLFPENKPPHAYISCNRATGTVPFHILCDGVKSSDPEGKKLVYEWRLDGDILSHEASWQTTLTTPKTYHVVLLVRDPKKLENTDSVMIDVIPAEPTRLPGAQPVETSTPTAVVVQIVIPTVVPRFESTPTPKPKVNIRATPKPAPTATPGPRSHAIAVLIVEEGKNIDWTLGSAIASQLQQRGIMITSPSLFTTSFVSDGNFAQLFGGSVSDSERRQLPQHFKSGILGKKSVSYVTNPEYADLIVAEITLELHVVSAQSGTVQTSVSWTRNGPGYSRTDAKRLAEERIIQDVEANLASLIQAIH